MNNQEISEITLRAKETYSSTLKENLVLITDAYKEDRLKSQGCLVCYYIHGERFGGAAMTHSKCSMCNKSLTFGTTCVDEVCSDCAALFGLCKICGGDIDMKQRKKGWVPHEKI